VYDKYWGAAKTSQLILEGRASALGKLVSYISRPNPFTTFVDICGWLVGVGSEGRVSEPCSANCCCGFHFFPPEILSGAQVGLRKSCEFPPPTEEGGPQRVPRHSRSGGAHVAGFVSSGRRARITPCGIDSAESPQHRAKTDNSEISVFLRLERFNLVEV